MQNLDAAQWADDEQYATTIARLRHRAAVNELIAPAAPGTTAPKSWPRNCRPAAWPRPRWPTSRRCTPMST